MGLSALDLSHCTEAMDLMNEYIFIASFNNFYNNITNTIKPTQTEREGNGQELKEITITSTLFLNKSLREHLGITTQEEKGEKEKKENYFKGVKVNILNISNGTYYTKLVLRNFISNSLETFFGEGKIKKEEGICMFKIYTHEIEEQTYLSKLYNKLDLYMSVIELGPEDGEYEWRHLLPNNHSCKVLKDTPENLSRFNVKERTALKGREHFYNACKTSKETGSQYSIPVDVMDTYFPLATCCIAYLGPHPITNGDLYGGVVWDSEKAQMFHERVQELGGFFEHAPLLMGAMRLQGSKMEALYGNQSTADFCNIPKSALKGDISHTPLFSGDLYSQFMDHFKKSRGHSESVQFLLSAKNGKDGKEHFMSATTSSISYDQKSDTSTHVFILVDITAQKEAEIELETHKNMLEETVRIRTMELQENELRFRSLVSNAPNIILSIDRQGLIGFANRHFVETKTSCHLIGKYLQTIVVDAPELMEKIRFLFDSKKSFIAEVKLLESDIWLNLSAGYMSESTAIIVATDITEMKGMSEELQHALATKSRFLANMSHEIRTPLSGIIGMARILMDSSLSMDQTDCVATIQYCGETLLSVINDVLDYTKLEATGMVLDNSDLSLRQCIEESLYTVLPTAQKKNLELIIDIDTHIPDRILGDMLRLRQVIVNLLNNAVKFTDTGYVQVSLTATENYGTDEWVFKCKVKDTGIGVAPESQGKLFQMFSQVDISTTRRYGGTGIGLALAKRFLEMMNGSITMKSTGVAGQGSTFTFTLTATLAPFAVCSPTTLNSPRWLISSTNIFIIENCPASSHVLKRRLTAKGFLSINILSGPSPQASLTAIETFMKSIASSPSPSPSSSSSSHDNKNILIFCDIDIIPPKSSLPLFEYPHLAVVLMGYAQPKTFQQEYPPCCDFLRKPIKQAALIACLRDVWGRFEPRHFFPPITRVPSPSSSLVSLGSIVFGGRPSSPSSSSSVSSPFSSSSSSPCSSLPMSNLAAKAASNASKKNGAGILHFYPLTIMVVEDNEMNQKVVRRVLSHLGYTADIVIANHGKEALELIDKNGMPDFILMDLQMPVLDGVQTTKIIRNTYSQFNNWPYIASMTADAFPEDRKVCLEAGMNDFLTKPIRVDQIQGALHKCFKLKESLHNNTPKIQLLSMK